MSTTKHTPGPWRVDPFPTIVTDALHILDSRGYVVAMCYNVVQPDIDFHANAVLVATAPELLAVVKSLMNAMDECFGKAKKIAPLQKAYVEGWTLIEKLTGENPAKFL